MVAVAVEWKVRVIGGRFRRNERSIRKRSSFSTKFPPSLLTFNLSHALMLEKQQLPPPVGLKKQGSSRTKQAVLLLAVAGLCAFKWFGSTMKPFSPTKVRLTPRVASYIADRPPCSPSRAAEASGGVLVLILLRPTALSSTSLSVCPSFFAPTVEASSSPALQTTPTRNRMRLSPLRSG
jgi:hypothetical protein